LTVHEFLEKLADPTFPGPASGSAAAIAAAMAAALLEMSCKVSMKKDIGNIPTYLNEIEDIRKKCLNLATKDMKSLTEVIRTAKSKAEFPDEFENAMKNATDPLVGIVKNSESILILIEKIIGNSSKKVMGELAGSTNLAEAAAASAKRGVEVNLRMLRDEQYKENILTTIGESYKKSSETKDRILKIMDK
jgi:formiminotetrahydrofolate cyclodeaminase